MSVQLRPESVFILSGIRIVHATFTIDSFGTQLEAAGFGSTGSHTFDSQTEGQFDPANAFRVIFVREGGNERYQIDWLRVRVEGVSPDTDGDGVPDPTDNCPHDPNPAQENLDGDAAGDVCDADDDNDGIGDVDDNCPIDINADQLDFDLDGLGNACDAVFSDDVISQEAENNASVVVGVITAINLPGGNGMIAKLTGNGGVTRKIANAVAVFGDGLINVSTYLSELQVALDQLDAFDNQLAAKIRKGLIDDNNAQIISDESSNIRILLEDLIAAVDG